MAHDESISLQATLFFNYDMKKLFMMQKLKPKNVKLSNRVTMDSVEEQVEALWVGSWPLYL